MGEVNEIKADKNDLEELESRVGEKFRDMVQEILKKFANKDVVMKSISQLNKSNKDIIELLLKQ